MKRSFFFRGVLFFVGFLALFALKTASAYITTLSAPVVSKSSLDQDIYFQGPGNLFYKVASDNPEVEIASDDNPTWVDYDVTALAATQLGTSTIASPPAVPGDDYCYFQNGYSELCKIATDGTGFVDMGVRSLFAPAVTGDGYAYYFTDRVPDYTHTHLVTSLNPYPKLCKIPIALPSGATIPASVQDLGQWGISAPCVANGIIAFQGTDSRLLTMSTSGLGGANSFISEFGNYVTTLSTPLISTTKSGSKISFARGNDTNGGGSYSGTAQILSFVDIGGTNLYSSSYSAKIAPYYAPNGYVYFVDSSNEVFEFDMTTKTATDLYIQAGSTPTGRLNSDGSLTLIYQSTANALTMYTIYH